MHVVARAPGRVNLIGDHTDYTGGLCLPMAIDRGVVVAGSRDPRSDVVVLTSESQPDPARVPLDIAKAGVESWQPPWARYLAGVVAELRPETGFTGTVTSTLPAGAGLSSSAAFEVACALALGADGSEPVALARLCQAAEHSARGVPTGLLDQLASIGGVAGHGLLLDCRTLTMSCVELPPADEAEWLVVHTGERSLADSGYSDRVRELASVEDLVGPLRDATPASVESVDDPTLRARARHVVTENDRVLAFAAAVAGGDLQAAGLLMNESHVSLSGDFACSTAHIDELCAGLWSTPGVLGARITGGGWGGSVVALTRRGAIDPRRFGAAWFVRPGGGASVSVV